jgi:hypothetical protein
MNVLRQTGLHAKVRALPFQDFESAKKVDIGLRSVARARLSSDALRAFVLLHWAGLGVSTP